MRRGHGSTKVPNVKLRPAKKGTNLPRDQDLDVTMYEVGGGSARETLRDDAKPFSGMMICCSGVKDKAALLAKARELGATCTNDLTDLTTHLVADAPGSAKHQVALKLGLHICTSDWIIETHKRWLAGEDVDPDEAVSEHLLPSLRGVVICVTRLTENTARQRLTKSATRLGAKYQAHMDKAATHLLIGPDDAGSVDSQKLQWVIRTNAKRAQEQSEEPPIHVVWDVWLLTCAATNSRVPESDFEYSDTGTRPELPKELEELLKRPPSKKPAKIYVPASNVGTGTGPGTKEVLEKARFKKSAATEAVWNSILSSRNQAPQEDDDEVVPPTPMQARGIPTSTPPTSIPPIPAKPLHPAAGEDSATEDEEESLKDRNAPTASNRVAQKQSTVELPIPSNRGATLARVQSGAAGSSMVSRLNSLRGSAFQLGATLSDHNVPASSGRGLARITSNATLAQKLGSGDAVEPNEARSPSVAAKVFVGKRIAPIGEARGPMLYAALRAHGAIVIEGSDVSDQKGKGKAIESEEPIALPSEEVDYYIVRLASESAKQAIKLDSYSKFRTDCWVEHCIFEDRLCPCEENVTYVPLKIELPVPEAGSIKLHWTGLNNEQETAVKRLAKALGITTTESFAKRINTHLLCPSRSGLKYDKALQWGVIVVGMDWLYAIATEGRISDTDVAQARLKLEQSTSRVDAADTSRLGETSGIFGVGSAPLFGVTNGLLAPPDSSPHKEPEEMPVDSNENRGSGSDRAQSNPLLELKREASVPVLDVQPENSTTEPRNRSVVESDREREREAQRNQLANSLDALLKKHQREESIHSDQPRKRIRPTMRHKVGESTTAGGTARSRSLTEKVSSLSLSTRLSDSDYVSPLEGIEPANEETLQVHYHDPNQLAAKEGLRRLLDGSSQAPDSEIINVDTQTEAEESPVPVPVEPKRKRGGAGTRRRGQRRP